MTVEEFEAALGGNASNASNYGGSVRQDRYGGYTEN